MFVCCERCVLSGRGLSDELIARPEESYRLWCVVVCDLEKPQKWGAMSRFGSQRHNKKKIIIYISVIFSLLEYKSFSNFFSSSYPSIPFCIHLTQRYY
jgi:hypothetical protein